MPVYRIHRIKGAPRESFRWAAHSGGEAVVKAKDYEASREVEAPTPYAAWKILRDEGEPLAPGDLLQVMDEPAENTSEVLPAKEVELYIAKYIGFDPARWFVPEPKKAEARPSLSSEGMPFAATEGS